MKILENIELKKVPSIRMEQLVEYMGSVILIAWNDDNLKKEYESMKKLREEKKNEKKVSKKERGHNAYCDRSYVVACTDDR